MISHEERDLKKWLPIIRSIARGKSELSANYKFADRVQDGLIGAWKAIESYDPVNYPDVPLNAWITMKIKRYMLDGSLRESRFRVVFIEDQVFANLNEDAETLPPPSLRTDPIEEFFRGEEERDAKQAMKQRMLSEMDNVKNADILRMYVDGMTMKKIGEERGVTESRISQIIKTAKEELRERVGRPPAPLPEFERTPRVVCPRPVPEEERARDREFWKWVEEQKAKLERSNNEKDHGE